MKISEITLKLFAAPVLILLLSGLSIGQDVRYNYLPGTNFGIYKTYKWVRVANHNYPPQIVDTQIKQAIDEQLSLKGMKMVADGNADLYITYQLAIDQETQWYSYGGYGWRVGMGSISTTSSTISIGTLIVDFYDAAKQQQIWSGTATKQLNPSKDPEKNQKNLKKAMAKLMKNYPPSAKK